MHESPHKQPTIGQLQVIAGAIMACPLVYVVVGVLLRQVGFRHPLKSDALCWAMLGISVLLGLAAVALDARLLSPRAAARKAGGNTMGHFTRNGLLMMALAELPSVVGLVCFILSGNMLIFALCVALALASMAQVFPTHARYDAMCAGLETTPDRPTPPDRRQ